MGNGLECKAKAIGICCGANFFLPLHLVAKVNRNVLHMYYTNYCKLVNAHTTTLVDRRLDLALRCAMCMCGRAKPST